MPLDDYERMCSLANLRRAYRWTLSNPDARYKGYFRDAYAAYAASSDLNLRRLRKHLTRHAYEPGHASKVYLPKPSGILRPYTLLTVNDQIVYQACVNVIAEKLKPKVKGRYFKTVFGHLYGGKSSKFFYLRWQKGYQAYTNSVLNNFKTGFNYVANFDLASFYDSIDHHVLRHFLRELKVDADLIDFLLPCLRTWTSSTWTNLSNVIYHEHGIPQGPLASGLLSEVVLKHIDDRGLRRGKTHYLRYVDDIKLFAKSENILRQRLVSLDLAAKEVGLFPQSSKVNIRRVTDPLSEIKSVSRPAEPAVTPVTDQQKLRIRLRELTRRGKVDPDNLSRFKYLIARAAPHYSLNPRFVQILESQPALFSEIAAYFSKYEKLPLKAAHELIEYLRGDEIYHAAHGSILFSILDNMQQPQRNICADFCYRRLITEKRKITPQPTYKAALIAWALRCNRLKFAELRKLMSEEVDWWVAKDWLKHLKEDQFGPASYESLLNERIRQVGTEPARVAALKITEDTVVVHNPYRSAQESARLLLYAAGKVRHIGKPTSMVGTVLSYVLDEKFHSFDWCKLFAGKHNDAEQIAFTIKMNFESDINACIVTLDSLCDLLWETIFSLEEPHKKYGNYGSVLKHPTLLAKYPKACAGLDALHQLRLESVTAHPRHSKSGMPTRRLKHHEFYKVRPAVQVAIEEIVATVTF